MVTILEPTESEEAIDWRDKQLVEDIERHGADPLEVNLEWCTFWNKYVYGDPKNPKDTANRKRWSNKIQVSVEAVLPCRTVIIECANIFLVFFQTLKRRERKGTYYDLVVNELGLVPSERTKASHQKHLQKEAPRPPSAPIKKESALTDEEAPSSPSPLAPASTTSPSPTTAPPEPAPPSVVSPKPRRQVTRTRSRRKSLTPTRPTQVHSARPPATLKIPTMSAPLDNDALSTLSDPVGPNDHFGGLYNPEKCTVSLAHNGRYANNIHVYQVPAMKPKIPAGQGPAMGFPGYLFMKAVQEGSLLKYSCTVATEEYMDKLVSLSKITEEEREVLTGFLFKCPAIESNDRVGKSAIIKHRFPCKETHEQAQLCQAKVSNDAQHYTLILIPQDFDNRVFSPHDHKVQVHFSCPEAEDVKEIGMKITQFHLFWRIAFRGQGFPLAEEGDDSLAEIVKQARLMKPYG